jgi:hypothetical protein
MSQIELYTLCPVRVFRKSECFTFPRVRNNHYDPAKEAAKQQWKKAKKAEDKKSEEPKGVHPYWIYSSDEDEA